jgi:hypothetical protein
MASATAGEIGFVQPRAAPNPPLFLWHRQSGPERSDTYSLQEMRKRIAFPQQLCLWRGRGLTWRA